MVMSCKLTTMPDAHMNLRTDIQTPTPPGVPMSKGGAFGSPNGLRGFNTPLDVVGGTNSPNASGVPMVPDAPSRENYSLCLHLTCKKFSLFKANFLHLKELEKIWENLQTALGKNPHWMYT